MRRKFTRIEVLLLLYTSASSLTNYSGDCHGGIRRHAQVCELQRRVAEGAWSCRPSGCTSGIAVSFSRLSGRQAYVDLMKVNHWSIAHIIRRATQADEESIGTFRDSRVYQDRAETVPREMTSGTHR